MWTAFTVFSAEVDADCVAFSHAFDACLRRHGLSRKAAALTIGIDEPRLSRYLNLGTLPAAFLVKLPPAVRYDLLSWMVARDGWGLVTSAEVAYFEAVRALRRVLLSEATGAEVQHGEGA